MNPILLLCQCDSVVTKACGTFIPVVKETYEAGTNYEDVAIAQSICCAVVAIVLIGALAFLAWTLMQLHAQKNVAVRKRQWDEEDKNRQDTANKENRQNMLEDEKRKRKNSLMDQKLSLLKELCKQPDKVKKSEEKKETKETNNSKKCEGIMTCESKEETKECSENAKYESIFKESTNEDVKQYLDALDETIKQNPA